MTGAIVLQKAKTDLTNTHKEQECIRDIEDQAFIANHSAQQGGHLQPVALLTHKAMELPKEVLKLWTVHWTQVNQ